MSNTFIPDRPLSTHPAAVRLRERRLQEDGFAEKMDAYVQQSRRHKRHRELKTLAENRLVAKASNRSRKALLDRIRFHLSKGRDSGDIAIRERLLVSKVQEIITEIQG